MLPSFPASIAAPVVASLLLVSLAGAASFDVNGDNSVDAADLIRLLEADRSAAAFGAPEDLDGDGSVTESDIALLIGQLLEPGGRPLPPAFEASLDVDYYTSNSQPTLKTASEEPVDIFLNGVLVAEDVHGEQQFPVYLEPGSNVLEAAARPAGTEDYEYPARRSLSVVLDVEPPQIILDAPIPGTRVATSKVMLMGSVVDAAPQSVVISGPSGEMAATLDPDGFWSAEYPLAEGVNDLTITATDLAGLANSSTFPVVSFVSPPMTRQSEGDARIELPEGALPNEDMIVRVDDISTEELRTVLNYPGLMATMMEGMGLEDMGAGDIIMPAGMVLEVVNGPEDGNPLFQQPVQISVPNVTNADNSMPIWIFQITPDVDGDGEPQLTMVSRGQVNETGDRIVPVVDGTTPVDLALPGFQAASNERFDGAELNQVATASAVKRIQKRIAAGRLPEPGPDVAFARAPFIGGSEEILPTPTPLSVPKLDRTRTAKQGGGNVARLLIDDFEDGDLVNELQPAGLAYIPDPSDDFFSPQGPLRPTVSFPESLADRGFEELRKPAPLGINGGINLRGTFANPPVTPYAEIIMKLHAGREPLNLSFWDEVYLEFYTRGPGGDGRLYEVQVEDTDANGNWVEFETTGEWTRVEIPLDRFGVDPNDLQRIHFRHTGDPGAAVQFDLDHVSFITRTPADEPPPPTPEPTPTYPPTVTPSMTPTATPTGATPTPSPSPTRVATQPGLDLQTPTADPTPVLNPTPTPGIAEEDPPAGANEPRTQVTFYCCAATAARPYRGKTKLDEDDPEAARFRECLADALVTWQRCEQNFRRLVAESQRLADDMQAGYDTAFGTVEIAGRRVPLIVNGALFKSFPLGIAGGAGLTGQAAQTAVQQTLAANAARNLLVTAADTVQSVQESRQAISSGNPAQIRQAQLDTANRTLTAATRNLLLLTDPNVAGNINRQLQASATFRRGFQATVAAANIYKMKGAFEKYFDGFFNSEAALRAVELEAYRCTLLRKRFEALVQAERGSELWNDCVQGEAMPLLDEEIVAAGVSEHLLRRTDKLRKQMDDVRDEVIFLRDFVERTGLAHEALAAAMDAAGAIENNPDLSDEDLITYAERQNRMLIESMVNFQWLAENTDRRFDAVEKLAEASEMAASLANLADAFGEELEAAAEGIPTVAGAKGNLVVNPQGENGASMTAVRSAPNGDFVGYVFSSVARVDNAVTFPASNVTVAATTRRGVLEGSTSVSIPEISYPFTEFSTVEYSGVVDAPDAEVGYPAGDDGGEDPVPQILFPDPSGEALRIAPDVPLFLRGRATDDVLVGSSRFLIDGVPTDALGTDGDNDTEFEGWFLPPQPEEGATRMLSVVAQAVDLGGNVGSSAPLDIVIDPTVTEGLDVRIVGNPVTGPGSTVELAAYEDSESQTLVNARWFVDGIEGGSDALGIVSPLTGTMITYRAPDQLEGLGQDFTITAIAIDEPTRFGREEVRVSTVFSATAVVSVLNLSPASHIGLADGASLSVLNNSITGAFGVADSPPVNVLNSSITGSIGLADSPPLSVLNTSATGSTGIADAPPVVVENQATAPKAAPKDSKQAPRGQNP